VIVRQAVLEDAPQIAGVMENVEASGWMLFNPGERNIEESGLQQLIHQLGEAPKARFFVAVEQGDILGYAMIRGEQLQRTSHRAAVMLGVHDASRGKGVGTALFGAMITWAKEAAIHRLELTVIEHNTQALHLYKKMGFEVEGIKKDSLKIDEAYVNEVYMSKIL